MYRAMMILEFKIHHLKGREHLQEKVLAGKSRAEITLDYRLPYAQSTAGYIPSVLTTSYLKLLSKIENCVFQDLNLEVNYTLQRACGQSTVIKANPKPPLSKSVLRIENFRFSSQNSACEIRKLSNKTVLTLFVSSPKHST